MHGLLNLSNCLYVLRPLGDFAIDPFARHFTVTLQLYGKPIAACVDNGICGSQLLRCLVFDLLPNSFALFLCSTESVILLRTNVTIWYLSSRVISLFSRSHPILFACPFRSDFIPHVSTIVPSPLMHPSCMASSIPFHHSPSRTSPPKDFSRS